MVLRYEMQTAKTSNVTSALLGFAARTIHRSPNWGDELGNDAYGSASALPALNPPDTTFVPAGQESAIDELSMPAGIMLC